VKQGGYRLPILLSGAGFSIAAPREGAGLGVGDSWAGVALCHSRPRSRLSKGPEYLAIATGVMRAGRQFVDQPLLA